MSAYIGIDVGAISITAAVLTDRKLDAPAADGVLRPSGRSARTGQYVYLSEYRRTHGQPTGAAVALIHQIAAILGPSDHTGLCLTGGGAKLLSGKLNAAAVNEFKAIAVGAGAAGLSVRTVFEMGGETSKYLSLSPDEDGGYAIADYTCNGDCAAGTGAFIDQQAGRLGYPIEEVGPVCLSAERTAQVAGRCSVFAKSDMIHAQQKGYTPPEVLRGLCDAVARNFRTAVVRSRPVEPPVVFIGGVANNEAVVRAIREAFDLDETELIVPPGYAHIGAIGAAVVAARGERRLDAARIDRLAAGDGPSEGTGEPMPTTAPLRMDNVVLLRDREVPFEMPAWGDPIDAYLGIDVGSVSTNLALIDPEGSVITEIYTRTQGRPIEVVADALLEIRRRVGERVRICGVGATGSGRELIGKLVGADTINDEITAHKTGATFVGQKLLGGRIPDTIFEIGGQDSKYISLQDGVVVDFTMNDACAAGTGSFLEERAEELGISIKGKFADLALSSPAPIRLGERCTVFMERDVNSTMQQGASKRDVVAGLAYSVVYNYINRVVRGRKIGETIFFQGGTAYNDSVAAAFASVCGKEIIVPPHNGVIGAIGAALLARDKMTAPAGAIPGESEAEEGTYVADRPNGQSVRRSRFRGYDMSRIDYTLREFTCRGCSNHCQIQEFTVEGEKTYWGDKCSDRYRKRTKAPRKPLIDDLMTYRQGRLLEETDLPEVGPDALTFGIPLTMFAMEQLPFWRTLLAWCGFRTVLSDPTNTKIVAAGLATVVSEPCFPIIVAHGHVANLLDRREVDYILLPNIVSIETSWMDNESHLCPWHQTLPFVIRRSPAFEDEAHKLFTPTVHFREGRKRVVKELQVAFDKLGVPARRVASAVEQAFAAQDRFQEDLLAPGREALERLTVAGRPGIVVVGRPYNIHDPGVNLSVVRKLRDYYGVDCIPLDFLDTAAVDIRDVNDNMYWNLGRRVLAAAKIVGAHPNLHILHITNFKCGPDSFVKHFIRRASGKPFLSLQFDGHSNDAGVMTRCEAYLDSKGILRPWRKEKLTPATT